VKSLIVVDVGSTLGRFTGDGRSTTAVLASLAPPTFPRELIARTVCRILHRAPALTEDVPVPGDTTALPVERWTAVNGLAAAVGVVERWVEA
jgi:hypothetical protein